MTLWISREKPDRKGCYSVWTREPHRQEFHTHVYFWCSSLQQETRVNGKDFERFTGIKIKPGQCHEVKLVHVVLEHPKDRPKKKSSC